VVGRIEGDTFGVIGDAGIAGGSEELAAIFQQSRLRQLPRQRMFAPARAQEQDVHARYAAFFR